MEDFNNNNFKDIIGHENLIRQVVNSISSGTFSHAHLFIGEDGIGKSLIAKRIALAILGKDKDKQYADILEYRTAKNKQSIGVEEMENIIIEINSKPYEGSKKVIIIYEADKLTTASQNAFLKTIEEPPKGVYILLLCENSEYILDTIKSRCQIHKLERLSPNEITLFIRKKYSELSDNEIRSLSLLSDGIPGRAEQFLNDESFKEIRDNILDILLNINNKIEPNKYEAFFSKYKGKWEELLTWIVSYTRDVMIYKETGNESLIINFDKSENIKELSNMFSFNRLNGIINIVNDTRKKLIRNVNTSLVFEMMIINLQDN
ncbi:MAG: DNA polymerase III subunit delta' [Bacillota bacterium]|nr:DNA polymerase III subunit delta' [Bacillota bacterium]